MTKKKNPVSISGFKSRQLNVGVLGTCYLIQLSERTVWSRNLLQMKSFWAVRYCKNTGQIPSAHWCMPSGESVAFSQKNEFSLKIIRMSWNNAIFFVFVCVSSHTGIMGLQLKFICLEKKKPQNTTKRETWSQTAGFHYEATFHPPTPLPTAGLEEERQPARVSTHINQNH